MSGSKEVIGDLEAMASLLEGRSGAPISSNRKVLRTKLSNQEEKSRTPKVAKEEEELKGEEEKMSQVMWVDPIEEVERRKLKERVNALETQDLNNTVTMDTKDTMRKYMSPPPGFGPKMSEFPNPRAVRPSEERFAAPPPGFGPWLTFPR